MSHQQIKFGNILSVTSGIIVQGCNAQGVMGSGVAKAIRDMYPENFETYKAFETINGLHLGDVVIHKVNDELSIYNCITQEFYGKDGKKYVSYEAIHKSMKMVAGHASRSNKAVHYPMIGAGLGGGDWAVIQSVIDSVFHVRPGVSRTLWIQEQCATSPKSRAV
jgi:O-acetyl-ADP-ribose deacetylase (regulator of RNase III)